MKHVDRVFLFAVIGAAVLALAGTASASVITSPAGSVYTGEVKGESEGHVVFHSENAPTAFTIECQASIGGTVTQHGSSVTAGGIASVLTLLACTNSVTVIINKTGSLEVHPTGGGNGQATSTNAEITAHIGGLGIKCVFTTNSTFVGTVTGSSTTKGTATVDYNSFTVNRTGGSAFCGTGGFMTGSGRITTPDYLDVS